MKRICVFAGSNPGLHPDFEAAAQRLGNELATRGFELVYGGSSVGLMGRVADAALAAGGVAIGVRPAGLFRREIAHTGLTEQYEVKDMHARKAKMNELSDAFIALPGGFGTFEEVFEVVSWGQIGIHSKPLGLLNVAGFYTPLVEMVKHAVDTGFIPAAHAELVICESDIDRLLTRLSEYKPPAGVNKWVELDEGK